MRGNVCLPFFGMNKARKQIPVLQEEEQIFRSYIIAQKKSFAL